MKIITFHTTAFEQYNEWARSNVKIFERIQRLIIETGRNPFIGIGKPEPLRGELRDFGQDG